MNEQGTASTGNTPVPSPAPWPLYPAPGKLTTPLLVVGVLFLHFHNPMDADLLRGP